MANISRSRKSGFTLRSGVMRRETKWTSTGVIATGLAAAGTSVQLATFTAAFLLDNAPFTIMRTRGVIIQHTDQIAATEDQEVAYGIAVVTEQANAIGVTAVPTPFTDSESDSWFVYEVILGEYQFGSAIGFSGSAAFTQERIIDSKAQRKVEDGFDISAVVESSSTSAGLGFASQFRMLIKLH